MAWSMYFPVDVAQIDTYSAATCQTNDQSEADITQAISDFLTSMRSSDLLQVKRALLALVNIVKELATARIQSNRRHLYTVAPEIIAVVGDIYARAVESWRNGGETEQMELSLIAVELAGRLLITGFENPNRDSTAASFWSLTIDHLTAFIPLLHSINPDVSRSTRIMSDLERFNRLLTSTRRCQIMRC